MPWKRFPNARVLLISGLRMKCPSISEAGQPSSWCHTSRGAPNENMPPFVNPHSVTRGHRPCPLLSTCSSCPCFGAFLGPASDLGKCKKIVDCAKSYAVGFSLQAIHRFTARLERQCCGQHAVKLESAMRCVLVHTTNVGCRSGLPSGVRHCGGYTCAMEQSPSSQRPPNPSFKPIGAKWCNSAGRVILHTSHDI